MIDDAAPLLSIRDLTVVSNEGSALLTDVDLDLRRGEIVTLVGPSGAGKSTLAAAVAGIAQAGVTRSGTRSLAAGVRVGYLPQDAALTLNPARRIGTALGELVTLHGEPPHGYRRRREWRAEGVIDLLTQAAFPVDEQQFTQWRRRFPFEFSGGQRTRLALAQVLATRPDLLVLDEPSTGLDAHSRRLLIDSLRTIQARGVAILLVTHDPYVATELGDRIAHVSAGTLGIKASIRTLLPAPSISVRADSSTEAALRVTDLVVRARGHDILHGISLSVGVGELVGLGGESGSGKTTVARAVAGLVTVAAGSVSLAGIDLPRLGRRSRAILADVGYVCQEVRASFEPDRPVIDQVSRTSIRLRGATSENARADAQALLARLGLDLSAAHRRPDALSGGQLRRAALARAMIARPRILICDEVTTGLEQPLSELILDSIDELRRTDGTAVVLIGHDLEAFADRLDRQLTMRAGLLLAAPGDDGSRLTQ